MYLRSVTVNGTDIKSYMSKYGLVELEPRKVYGPNSYTAANGHDKPDYLLSLYDIRILLNPLKAVDIPGIIALFPGDTSTVTYWSTYLGQSVTKTMQHDISALVMALQDAYKEVYEGLEITLTEL